MHVAIDDGAADAAVASDADVGKQNALVDFAVGIYTDVGGEDRIFDRAAGDDAAAGDDGVEGGAGASGFGENEFGWWVLSLVGADGPVIVVEVEDGGDRDDVHVGFVVSLEGAYVPPIESFLLVFVDEVVAVDAVVGDHSRENIFAEVVAGLRILGVLQQDWDKNVGVKDVNAHGGGDLIGIGRVAELGFPGLFFEAVDAAIAVNIHNAEVAGLVEIDLDRGEGDVGG